MISSAFVVRESLDGRLRPKGVRAMLYLPSEQGQGIVEYALLLVMVTLIVIVILALIGPAIGNVFSNLYVNM